MGTDLHILRQIGSLPPGWDRQVAFFANLLSLFFGNEAETAELRQKVGALETYGGRLLPILNLLFRGPDNLLVLDREPDINLTRYFREDLALDLPRTAVLPHADYLSRLDVTPSEKADRFLAELVEHPAEWVDGFVTDDAVAAWAAASGKATIAPVAASRQGNNKVLLHRALQESGLPVFESFFVATPADAGSGCAELRSRGYRQAVIKSQIGASGIGLLKLDLAAPMDLPTYLFFEGECLLQGWLDTEVAGVEQVLGSPSVQLFLTDDQVVLYDFTEQILSSDSIHEGNVAPPDYAAPGSELREELLAQAEYAAGWLHQQAYRGTASVDFHVIRRNGRHEVRVCEINARVTGATYPSVLARHLAGPGAWLMRNLRFSSPIPGDQLLKELQQAELLVTQDRVGGVCPINLNQGPVGGIVKGQFLCLADTTREAWDMLATIQRAIHVEAIYDRD